MMLADNIRSRTITWADPERTRRDYHGYDGFERLAAIQRGDAANPPAAALLGMAIEELQRGRVVVSIVADEVHENPMGTMHGGVIAALVDTAMGCAVMSTLPADRMFTTLDLSTNYIRSITKTSGLIFAEGAIVHVGGRVATAQARVFDTAQTLFAHATSTCLISEVKS
jgi:uncharacterized protein (TIGR00369 family)